MSFLGYDYRYNDYLLIGTRKAEFAALALTVSSMSLIEIQALTAPGSTFNQKVDFLNGRLEQAELPTDLMTAAITGIETAYGEELVGDARIALSSAFQNLDLALSAMQNTWRKGGFELGFFSINRLEMLRKLTLSTEHIESIPESCLVFAFLTGQFSGKVVVPAYFVSAIQDNNDFTNLSDDGFSVSGNEIELELDLLIEWAIENKDYSPS